MNTPAVPGYRTVGELAELTGLPQSTVRWHCRQGHLAGRVAYTDRIWLIPEAIAQDFLTDFVRRRRRNV